MNEIINNWEFIVGIFTAGIGFFGTIYNYGIKIGKLQSNHDENLKKIENLEKTVIQLNLELENRDKRISDLETALTNLTNSYQQMSKENQELLDLVQKNTKQIIANSKRKIK